MGDDALRDTAQRLLQDLEKARKANASAQKRFNAISRDVPSGLPHPDGVFRIKQAGKQSAQALEAYRRALNRLSDYLLCGVIPKDLKD